MKKASLAILALAAFIAAPLSSAQAQAVANADRKKVVENFAKADGNRDSMLSFDEFTSFLKLNARDNLGKAAQIVRTGHYRLAFDRVDADRNGVVSRKSCKRSHNEIT